MVRALTGYLKFLVIPAAALMPLPQLMIGPVSFGSTAKAEVYACPQGPGPGEVSAGYWAGGGGTAGVELCEWVGEAEQQSSSNWWDTGLDWRSMLGPEPEPRRRIYSFAAVAWHPRADGVWATWNQFSEGAAQATVLDACNVTMGGGCTLAQTVRNGSIAVGKNSEGVFSSNAGANEVSAKAALLDGCRKDGSYCGAITVYTSEVLSEPERYGPEDRVETERSQVFQGYSFPANSKVQPPKPDPKAVVRAKTEEKLGNAPKGMTLVYQGIEGSWFEPERKEGDACGLMYGTDKNMLILFGPKGKSNGSFMFMSPSIPPTQEPRQVEILYRAVEGEAKMPALLTSMGKKSGAIMIPVKMKETMAGIKDVGRIEILLDGKSVYASEFEGGFKARDAMNRCMSK